jgi:type I restriction enzyme S subunit
MFDHPHPADWETKAVYDLAIWTNGLAFRDIQFTPTGTPVIKIAELKGGISGQTRFTQARFDESVRVSAGHMLFSWSGNPDTSIDVFIWAGPDGWLNQHIFRVTPRAGIEWRFLYYLLKFLKASFTRIASNKQTTGLGHVTGRDLREMKVGIPKPEEQRAIVEVLVPLDDKIDLNRRLNATLESMARSTFQSWFVDFGPVRAKAVGHPVEGLAPDVANLFPASLDHTPFGEVPAGWLEMSLPEAFQINPQRSLAKGQLAPYLDMANMPTNSLRAVDVYDREFGSGMRFIEGDTLVARITPCLENGKTAFVDFLGPDKVGWGSTEYIVLRPKPPLPLCYAYFLARTNVFRSFAISNMTGSSGRQRVPNDCFNKFKLVVPTEKIACAFADLAEPLLEKIKANDAQNRTLAALRDSLLPKLLSGEVRLAHATDKVKEATQ